MKRKCCSGCVFNTADVFGACIKSTVPLQLVGHVHQLPLQLHWIFPCETGSAVTNSLTGVIAHLVTLEGGDSLLDS